MKQQRTHVKRKEIEHLGKPEKEGKVEIYDFPFYFFLPLSGEKNLVEDAAGVIRGRGARMMTTITFFSPNTKIFYLFLSSVKVGSPNGFRYCILSVLSLLIWQIDEDDAEIFALSSAKSADLWR